MGQYCREVEIEVEIEPIEREGRMRIYIPKFCYLKVNKIRPDKPITVPAQGYFISIPRCFSSQIPPWRWTKPAHLSVSYMSSLI